MAFALEYGVASDVGPVRANNEDAVLACPQMVAIADGVGGSAGGEVASRLVVDAIGALGKRWLTGALEEALRDAIAEANEAVAFVTNARPGLAGMASTLAAVAIDDDTIAVANIGDSRAYLLRSGCLRRLTRDDSLVEALIDAGAIDAEQALTHPQRSAVLAAIDGQRARVPRISSLDGRDDDRLMLCSDGLTDYVAETAIAAVLESGTPRQAAERLVSHALAAGSRDNVSVVVADLVRRASSSAPWRPY